MAKSDAHQGEMDTKEKTMEMEPTMEQNTEFLRAIKEILAEMRE
jgi:hypothetical protein